MTEERTNAAGAFLWPWWPPLYVYDVDGGDGRGVCGVSESFVTARRHLIEALRTMPNGASGSIRQALLDLNMLPHPDYRYGPVIVRAWRDPDTGVVRVDDNPAGRWTGGPYGTACRLAGAEGGDGGRG